VLPVSGYQVRTKSGTMLLTREQIEDAVFELRQEPRAHQAIREDGTVLAFKHPEVRPFRGMRR
jgi:hypothetical protein